MLSSKWTILFFGVIFSVSVRASDPGDPKAVMQKQMIGNDAFTATTTAVIRAFDSKEGISGTCTMKLAPQDPVYSPCRSVILVLKPLDHSETLKVRTDENGQYLFTDLKEKVRYVISTEKPYKVQTDPEGPYFRGTQVNLRLNHQK